VKIVEALFFVLAELPVGAYFIVRGAIDDWRDGEGLSLNPRRWEADGFVGFTFATPLDKVLAAVTMFGWWALIFKGGQKIVRAAMLFFILVLFAGCGTTMPTLSQQLKKPAAAEETVNFTDQGIMGLLEEQYQQWGGKSIRSQWATAIGPITLDAVVTAMQIVATRGASSSSLVTGGMVTNFFRRVFLGIDPEARLRAYNGGLKLLREAEFAYLVAVASRHRGRIPNNRITAAGAQLLGAILKAQDRVEDVIAGIVAKDPDSVSVQQAIQQLIAAALDREAKEQAEEEAAAKRAAEKKKETENEKPKEPVAAGNPALIPVPPGQ